MAHSDTFKAIAQRLGSAATNDRPGAKAKMGMRDTKGRGPFTLQYIASGLYGEPTWLLVDKAGKTVAKEHNEASAKEMLRKANAGEPVYVASRPGAKARMSKDWQTIERYLEVLDTEFGEPRGKAAAQEMMRAAAAIGGDEGSRLKAAINTMATSRDYNARQRAYNAIESMMPFSRPGAKAKMGRAEKVMRDGSVHLDFTAAKEWLSAAKDAELRYIVADSKSALNANPDGKKFNYYRDLVLEAMKELKKRGFSRPGAKAKMGKLSGLTDATLKGEATRLLRLWHHTKSGESGLQPSTVRYRILELVEEMQSRNMADPKLDAILKTTSFSRPGAKAKMGRTSEEYAEDVQNTWAIISRWVDSLRSPLMMENYREARQIVSKLAQVFARFEKELASPVTRLSRPGAKAKMDASNELSRAIQVFRGEVDGLDNAYKTYLKKSNQNHKGQVLAHATYLRKYADRLVERANALEATKFSRPGAKVANAVREGEKVSASDDAVSRKIRKLMDEGKPQKQAVAIALDLERRGEL